jgi:putative transposase
LTNAQRATLAEIARRMGRRALEQVASVAKPETILTWYRKLIARKFDGSKHRAYPGRPPINQEITELAVRMARENRSWGYDVLGATVLREGEPTFLRLGNIWRRSTVEAARPTISLKLWLLHRRIQMS